MTTSRSAARNPFDPAAIAPETAAFNARLEEQAARAPGLNATLSVQARREAVDTQRRTRSPLAHERVLAGVPCRVLLPARVRGVFIYLHGGGWTVGRPHHFDARTGTIAERAQVAVVSVDYRLAPEHPYPAAPDDCEAVAAWLVHHAATEFGTDQLVIGGDSSGAQLAVVTLLRLRDRHGYRGFRGVNLLYGLYDFSETPSLQRWGSRTLGLPAALVRANRAAFLPNAALYRDPDVSPLYADLASMPPALFTVGTLDPLLDDTLFMHARWLAAGNEAELAVYPGGSHGFTSQPIPIAEQARARMEAFIAHATAAPEDGQTRTHPVIQS
jgi:acetyl esterase/lipase